jgi:outer membrane protein OmpA-like peptidoglycan-associated protein
MTFSQGDLSQNDQQKGISSQQDSLDQVESDPLELLIDLLMDLSDFNDSDPDSSSSFPLEDQQSLNILTPDPIPSKPESLNPIPSIHLLSSGKLKPENDLILRLLPLLEKPPAGAMDVDYSVSDIEEDLPEISAETSPKLEENQDIIENISTSLPPNQTDRINSANLEKSLPENTTSKPKLKSPSCLAKSANIAEINSVSNSNNPLDLLQELMFGSNLGDDLDNFKSRLLNCELPEVRELVENINRKLSQIQFQIHDPEQLIELLLPTIGQILNLKVIESKDELIQAFIPIIDQIIKGKGQTDRQAMSEAIADLIPQAIKQQIKNSPKEIAQALGPEIGAAIREQIKIDRNEIAVALAPMIGRSIKEQVTLERDSMVDALYPVIGSTITRYLGEAIQEINEKVSKTFSAQGLKRKVQSKVQGVSEAELILLEVSRFVVQAVFLIHKGSGLIIAEIKQPDQAQMEAEMVAGMLTAIRSFVNDCISQTGEVSELNEIEYGDCKIILEVAGYCYLAVVVKGEPPKAFIKKIRQTMATLIMKYSQPIEDFDGDPNSVPEGIISQLEALIRVVARLQTQQKPMTLLILGSVVLSLILIPWGIHQYREHNLRQLETRLTTTLGAEPELSIYTLKVKAQGKTLALEGKVPSARLKDKIGKIAQQIAPNFQINNRIIAVKVPPDPIKVAAEVKQMVTIMNQISGTSISANYQNSQVGLTGKVIQSEDIEKITQAFKKIEGVDSVIANLTVQPLPISTRIYFNFGSAELVLKDIRGKLVPLAQYLKRYPDLKLTIIGYSHEQEKSRKHPKLALERAQTIQNVLEDLGIDRRRIETVGKIERPEGVDPNQELWLSQTVLFEIIPLQFEQNKPPKL